MDIFKKFDELYFEGADDETLWHFNQQGMKGIKYFIKSEVEEILREIYDARIYGNSVYDEVKLKTILHIFKKHGFDLTKKWL